MRRWHRHATTPTPRMPALPLPVFRLRHRSGQERVLSGFVLL